MSRRAGVVVGVVGSAPAVGWAIGSMLERAWSLSGWLGAAAAALLPAVVPLLVALFALAGGVGAAVGDWLAARVDRARDRARSRAGRNPDGDVSGWWRWVVAYIVFAPAVLLYTFGVGPESGAAFALSALALLVLVPFSVFAAVALFEDAVTLREAGRGWEPNYWAYVGAPLAASVVVYLVATALASPNPSGDSVYGFVVALWLSSAVYLNYRRRYGRTA